MAMPLREWCARSVFVGLLCLLMPGLSHAQSHELGIKDGHFTIDGTAKFLVFISYFDALDVSESELRADFDYFKGHGIDGIRIMIDWRTQDGRFAVPTAHYAQDTVMDFGGAMREGPFSNLVWVLNLANEKGLVVDLTLSNELVSSNVNGPTSLTRAELKNGLDILTQRLKTLGYKHVMFDLQNEYDDSDIWIQGPSAGPPDPNNLVHLTTADIQDLIDNHVHAFDSSRIVFASMTHTGDAHTNSGGQTIKNEFAAQHGMAIAYHDARDDNWWGWTGTVVNNLSGGLPVYLQEPAKFEDGPLGNGNWASGQWNGLAAVAAAKAAGAAAWTFHTSAGYQMNDAGLMYHLTHDPGWAAEINFLTNLQGTLNATNWGAPATGQTVTPVPALTSRGYPMLADFTGDHRADIGEWHHPSGQFWVRANTVNSFQPMGAWWAYSSTITPTTNWEVLTADFNGDGYADYMDRHIPSGKVWIHLGNGAGGFNSVAWVTGATRSGPDYEVFPGDVNGDHRADLIEHNRATGELHVRINTGVADPVPGADVINWLNFNLEPLPAAFHTATGSDWRTIVGDFTGDGYVDIVDYHVPSAHFWVHANIGGNQWNGGYIYDAGAFSYPGFTTLFADFTGDGYADYADVNTGTGDMWVHENLHNGTFSGANWAYTVLTHSSGFCVMGLPVCW
jgi:hypothetical protein